METLNSVLNILKVALGLGFVIFIHELGHFLLAKWNGVKVEKFSIGFGPTLYGFKRGDTEYVIAALPLGGFVKMLGEGPEDETTDPRAFSNKSVSARMAIFSAGVLMNLAFAYACFVYYHARGREDQPAVLGAVSAGSPGYQAGLRPGDEIVAIDERQNPGFADLIHKVVFSSSGQTLHFQIKRAGHEGLIDLNIEPRREVNGDRPTIGFIASSSLRVGVFRPPFGMSNPPAFPSLSPKERESKVDVLVSAAPEGDPQAPVADVLAYDQLLAKYAARPITHSFERRRILSSGDEGETLEKFEVTLPPTPFMVFGLRMEMGPVTGVRGDSPAEQAGFRVGDRIVKVDGKGDLDPLQLPAQVYKLAGKPVKFEIERPGSGGTTQTEVIEVTPADTPQRVDIVMENEPVDVASIGLCYPAQNKVAAVRPGSPADKAGIKAGDVIKSMKIKRKPTPGQPAPKSDATETIEFSEQSPNWFHAFSRLQLAPAESVELLVSGASRPKVVMPEPDAGWLSPDRGIRFEGLLRKLPPQDIATALRSGYDETIENIGMVYSTFRSLAQRRVSPEHLGGPILIAQLTYGAAGAGFGVLMFFLGVLSINLAVLNFLPIPPLDGGQMMFLIAEKVRGRPLPESALLAGTYFGLFLVLCLMLFVTYQDIFRLVIG